MKDRPRLKIGSVVIHCVNFDKMVAFWKEALHYVPREPAESNFVILRDPNGANTNVSLNKVSDSGKAVWLSHRFLRNWLHFDLYTDDQEREVERLLKLGAILHPQTYDPEDDFRVLEDPDGNLFCVVQLPKS